MHVRERALEILWRLHFVACDGLVYVMIGLRDYFVMETILLILRHLVY